jgi:ribonuclease-3
LIGDSVEALIGAYYLDSGYKQARKLVERLFHREIIKVEKNRHEKDYKSILQEFVQKRFKTVPQYTVINTEGPDHQRKFFVNVSMKKETYGPGIGKSKKQAEQNAAYIALKSLKSKRRFRDPSIEIVQHIEKEVRTKRFVRRGKRTKNRSTDVETRDSG